ncbi:hypothetical protein AMATHDRAFT_7114 [Amanita thiersii Skay4041]|uniref:Uncharacterized protein n=1 Tax=Amanita thiersii Skay4041 TaxID=703135 RepID=A0A2A9NAF4_9AGAR|nr:hypothetical protein AMATHDRAFT_7114 [Amanita thiersii Skay4041]
MTEKRAFLRFGWLLLGKARVWVGRPSPAQLSPTNQPTTKRMETFTNLHKRRKRK